jgi:hypothetical protein
MDVVVERCAGLDVHRDNVVATVRVPATGRRQLDQQTQTFNATLAGLAALGTWLAGIGVTLVGMEATGVYWKTVFQALEGRFECWLLNAHHLRNVPGRKTDVKDSEWICQLVQHGLVRPSFVPPPDTRPGPRWLTDILTECARAAVRTRGTYLAAHYAQLRGRRGEPVALGAIRHDIPVAYYHVVRDQVPYRDLGPDWQHKRYSPEHRARRLQRQLEALGYTVDLQPAEQAA